MRRRRDETTALLHQFEVEARRLGDAAAGLPTPPFPYEVALRESYDGLFADAGERLPAATLIEQALQKGRLIVHGEAGSGKTTMLLRLFAAAKDALPVFVPLQLWSPPLFDEWSDAEGNHQARIDLLLRQLGRPSVTEALLAALPTSLPRLIVIDGLNEVPRSIATGVLEAVDAFARRNTRAGVIVADRLTRRELPSDHWQIVRLLPIDRATVVKHLSDVQLQGRLDFLQRPFFLHRAIQYGIEAASDAGAVGEYIEQAVHPTPAEFDDASRAAFELYREQEARTFEYGRFAALATNEVAEKFEASGLLVRTNETAHFQHHLYHDYLASRWLASDAERWTRAAFDAVSFHASSFDALAMALEQVNDPEMADELILHIYDWNFYASAYALGKGREQGSVAVTERAEVALLAMLAERRWDPLRATAEAVTDALHFVPSDFARKLLATGSVAEIQESVAHVDPGNGYFIHWRILFLTPIGAAVENEVVELLSDPHPLLGWTASNVLRRACVTEQQLERIRGMLGEGAEWPTRWRAAHALGAHPNQENAEALRDALSDRDEWVRYGAIRALIEEASRDEALRGPIVQMALECIDRIASDPRTVGELQRALVLRVPPRGWAEAVAPIIEELWGRAETVAAQDRWRRLAYDVQRAEAA